MSDDLESNVSSIKPVLDPLKQMSSEDWGKELYKSYLISSLGLPPLAADHKASMISDAFAHAISLGVLKMIGELAKMTGEIEEKEVERLNDETRLKHTAEIIREEMARQAENIMFWDPADEEIFDDKKPEVIEGLRKNGDNPVFDRFDFEKIAKKIM